MTIEPRHLAKGDNLKLVDDIPTARDAVDLARSVTAGTVFAPAPSLIAGGKLIRQGADVFYRSLSGDVYEAIVTGIGPAQTVNVDVVVPGQSKRVPLRGIRFTPEEK